jgi:hypothetical protein
VTFTQAYHACFVVADLDATCTELGDLLGVEWAQTLSREVEIRTPRGTDETKFRYTYSTPASGACLFEIIEGPKGSVWYPGDDVAWAFHHVGFWTPDLAGTSGRLVESGLAVEATQEGPSDLNLFAYHQLANGPRVELVDTARQPTFYDWIGHEPA